MAACAAQFQERTPAAARAIILGQARSEAAVGLAGDKRFLFAAGEPALLMYGQRGRNVVGLFDPVGPCAAWPALIGALVAQARQQGGKASFYSVSGAAPHHYREAGLRLLKIGEEARIPLDGFSLGGASRASLRADVQRGGRHGLSFALVEPGAVPDLLPTLESISAAWLQARGMAEKRFAFSSFDPAALADQVVALVRQRDRPGAFATVLRTQAGTDATVGIMRRRPDAYLHTMKFLVAHLAMALRDHGYQWLSLGLAPLAGLGTPASRWEHAGDWLFRHGGRFYNFQGLRRSKDKFRPEWVPRYLATPGGLSPLRSLRDVGTLSGWARPSLRPGLSRTDATPATE